MELILEKKALLSYLNTFRKESGLLGLVPTMGALHQGHLSLVAKALSENKKVVVSIFVNPTQFNNTDDLENYPKTLEADLALLKELNNDLVIFAPSVKELYDDKISSKDYFFNGLDQYMEGAHRKGHFEGVATIVEMLLTLIKPDNAYFGEKDYQQLLIIRNLASQFSFPVNIVACPIVRESHGLAMSSRNSLLSEEARIKAGLIFEALKEAKRMFGTENASKVIETVGKVISEEALMELEYFQIADAETLVPIVKKIKNKNYRGFIAVHLEGVRLIDNIALN